MNVEKFSNPITSGWRLEGATLSCLCQWVLTFIRLTDLSLIASDWSILVYIDNIRPSDLGHTITIWFWSLV